MRLHDQIQEEMRLCFWQLLLLFEGLKCAQHQIQPLRNVKRYELHRWLREPMNFEDNNDSVEVNNTQYKDFHEVMYFI